MAMNLTDTLVAFGEFLDSRGECYDAKHPHGMSIEESHEEVARDFIKEWESDPKRATLAGREPITGSEAPVVDDRVGHPEL